MKKILFSIFTWLFIKPFSANNVKKERLLREIMALENEVSNFEWRGNGAAHKNAIDALKKAKDSANECDFESGWGYFYDAEQYMVKSMDSTQRQIKGKLLLIESEKFTSQWRKDQIKFLLGELCSKELHSISPDEISKAIAIRNDFYLTRSHKMNLHRVNVNILTSLMILLLAGILVLSHYWDITNLKLTGPDSSDQDKTNTLWQILIVSGIFGAFGAGFSYAKTLFSYNPELNKIPDQLLSMTVTFFRFVIGASAAIIVFLIFKSNFLNEEFSKTILDSPITYIVFSFVAGFSERWVVKMIGLVTKENV